MGMAKQIRATKMRGREFRHSPQNEEEWIAALDLSTIARILFECCCAIERNKPTWTYQRLCGALTDCVLSLSKSAKFGDTHSWDFGYEKRCSLSRRPKYMIHTKACQKGYKDSPAMKHSTHVGLEWVRGASYDVSGAH